MKKEELLLEYLKSVCPGRDRVQKSTRLERALQTNGAGLCRLVHRLRKRGEPIASSSDGYFYAVNAGELYATIQKLKRMVRGLEAAIRGLEGALERFGPAGTEAGGGGDTV